MGDSGFYGLPFLPLADIGDAFTELKEKLLTLYPIFLSLSVIRQLFRDELAERPCRHVTGSNVHTHEKYELFFGVLGIVVDRFNLFFKS